MKSFFKIILMLIVIVAALAGFLGYNEYTNYLKQTIDLASGETRFEVRKGSNIRTVAKQLEQENIIRPAWYFVALAKLRKKDTRIKAGEFKLESGMTPDDILDQLVSGRALQYKLSIIDGKTFKDVINDIKSSPYLKQTLSDDDYANIMQKLGSDQKNPEGWFYPDTYNFPKGTTDLQFLQRSYEAMKSALEKAWAEREPHPALKTPYEALILASIVEKETGKASERGYIARVFLNRLEKGMLLQTDPTVIYGMGDSYDGNIRKKDLKKDTPYNTYTRTGLPPTPIAIPGKAAIDAVMHPAEGKMLYFVAKGDESGSSYFSETYKEHKKAVIKYQLKGNKNRYTGDK
jgi:UPF0755 protein